MPSGSLKLITSAELEKRREEFYSKWVELNSTMEFTKLENEQRKERERKIQINSSEMKDAHRKNNKEQK